MPHLISNVWNECENKKLYVSLHGHGNLGLVWPLSPIESYNHSEEF